MMPPTTDSIKDPFEALHDHALIIYGFVISLALQEALQSVVPHLFVPPAEPPGKTFGDIFRLIVFVIVLVRFYLGAVIFFVHSHNVAQSERKVKESTYALDFLSGLTHFIFFFIWSFTVDTHTRPIWLFPGLLVVVLLFDIPWLFIFRANQKRPRNSAGGAKRGRRHGAPDPVEPQTMVKIWALTNLLTIILGVCLYFPLLLFIDSQPIAEAAALCVVLFFSLLDIVYLASGMRIFRSLFARLA